MKTTILSSALLAVLMCVSGGAQASLVGRDINGNAVAGSDASSVFLYDEVLKVTWLRDANYAQTSGYDSDGKMTWATATNWVANLTVGIYSDWRLPTMNNTTPQADWGFNVRTKSGNLTQYEQDQTVYSEMASLWYDTLGNKAIFATRSGDGPRQDGGGLLNKGDFQNMQSYVYWSGLDYAGGGNAWAFGTDGGGQSIAGKSLDLYAFAVRSGDVAPSAVPVPAVAWLMASGLGALGVAARKRRAKAA